MVRIGANRCESGQTLCDANGKWKVTFTKLQGGAGQTLIVKGRNELTVNDVAVGEVWLCSGQSNMDGRVGGYAKVMSEGFQQAQREMYAKQAREVDVIITTALIPGKPAPRLITADMVKSMKPGSVIVDMAAEQGGNCELTRSGKTVKEQFQNDLNLELQAVPRLNKAIACATAAHDNGSRELFEKILVDEEHHVDWLEAQLHMMSEVGEGNYLAQQIHKDE